MDIKHLDYFREIVDSNFNLSKAASKLHITQPSLSMLVTSWENQYGIKLFNKNKGRYHSLTKEGEYIYNHAIQLLKMHNEFLYSLEEIKRGFMGSVRIGIPSFIISLLFHNAIVNFMSNYPDINLTIIEEGSIELQKKLANGELDMAILNEPLLYEIFDTTQLYSDNLVVVMNKALDNTKDIDVILADLESENLVTFSEYFSMYGIISNLFKQRYLHPNIIFKASQWDLIMDLVSSTKCYSIVPGPVATTAINDNIVVKQIKDVDTKWNIILASNHSKIKNPALKFFEEYVVNYFDNYKPSIKEKDKPINIR